MHGWVSSGTGGMSFIDRNCIIKLDRILTLSWHAICSSSKKTLGSGSHGIWNSEVQDEVLLTSCIGTPELIRFGAIKKASRTTCLPLPSGLILKSELEKDEDEGKISPPSC